MDKLLVTENLVPSESSITCDIPCDDTLAGKLYISDIELVYDLIKRLSCSNQEMYELIKILWERIVNEQNYGYGKDDVIIKRLNDELQHLQNMIPKDY